MKLKFKSMLLFTIMSISTSNSYSNGIHLGIFKDPPNQISVCDYNGKNCTVTKETNLLKEIARQIYIPPLSRMTAYSRDEVKCLAQNIFHEAGVENLSSKLSVAFSTINRVKDHRWGNTICKVVFEPNQMSWTNNRTKSYMNIPREFIRLSKDILKGKYRSPECKATNWFNIRHDSKRSSNYKIMNSKRLVCKYAPPNSNHIMIAYR